MSQQYPGYEQPGPQQPYQDPYQNPQQKPRPEKPRWWVSKPFIAAVALVVGVLIGNGTAGGGGSETAASTITQTAPAEPAATVTTTVTQKAKAAPAAKPAASATIGEGTFIVGKDVKAGTYSVTVPSDSLNCYWERSKDSSGDMDSIIANDNLNAGAHGTVTIQSGEVFTTQGCGTWSK